jgi:hypothetical protein
VEHQPLQRWRALLERFYGRTLDGELLTTWQPPGASKRANFVFYQAHSGFAKITFFASIKVSAFVEFHKTEMLPYQ